jgi:four helix bundle protein
MRSEFRNLAAYQRAARLARDLQMVMPYWPKFERWSLGLQLVRASESIGCNIAEGCGRWTPRDRRHFLVVARGSLYETEHLIAQAIELGLLPAEFADRLDPIARPLSGLIRELDSR